MRSLKLWLVGISVLMVMMAGCKKSFDPEVLKKDSTPELSQKDKDDFTKLGKKPIKDLNKKEQDEVADLVVNYLIKIDWPVFLRQSCHVASLGSDTCENDRELCLEEVGKKSDDEIKAAVVNEQPKLKREVQKFLNSADISPEDCIEVFELFDYGLKVAATLDCNSSKEDMKNAQNKAEQEMITKYGKAQFAKLKKAAVKIMDGEM